MKKSFLVLLFLFCISGLYCETIKKQYGSNKEAETKISLFFYETMQEYEIFISSSDDLITNELSWSINDKKKAFSKYSEYVKNIDNYTPDKIQKLADSFTLIHKSVKETYSSITTTFLVLKE